MSDMKDGEDCLTPEQKAKKIDKIEAPARESGWLDWIFRGAVSLTGAPEIVQDVAIQGKDIGTAAMPDSSFRQGVDIISSKGCAPGEHPSSGLPPETKKAAGGKGK